MKVDALSVTNVSRQLHFLRMFHHLKPKSCYFLVQYTCCSHTQLYGGRRAAQMFSFTKMIFLLNLVCTAFSFQAKSFLVCNEVYERSARDTQSCLCPRCVSTHFSKKSACDSITFHTSSQFSSPSTHICPIPL